MFVEMGAFCALVERDANYYLPLSATRLQAPRAQPSKNGSVRGGWRPLSCIPLELFDPQILTNPDGMIGFDHNVVEATFMPEHMNANHTGQQ